jgi:hypothetical protein
MEKVLEKDSTSFNLNDLLDFIAPESYTIEGQGERITARIMKITPKLAEQFLSKNCNNRPVSKANIKYLVKQINAGNWMFDGASIKIDKYGNLIDGQHRLEAIIKSGKSLVLLVLNGFNSSVFTVLDTGRKRTGSDVLSINGAENATVVASSIRLINQFEKGSYGEGGSISRTLSNQEIVDFLDKNPKILESSKFGASLYKKSNGVITASLVSTFHFLLSQKSEEQALDFLTKLCLGTKLENDSPITALRNKLIKSSLNNNYRMLQSEIVRNIIVAWNKYRKGEKITKLIVHSNLEKISIE